MLSVQISNDRHQETFTIELEQLVPADNARDNLGEATQMFAEFLLKINTGSFVLKSVKQGIVCVSTI